MRRPGLPEPTPNLSNPSWPRAAWRQGETLLTLGARPWKSCGPTLLIVEETEVGVGWGWRGTSQPKQIPWESEQRVQPEPHPTLQGSYGRVQSLGLEQKPSYLWVIYPALPLSPTGTQRKRGRQAGQQFLQLLLRGGAGHSGTLPSWEVTSAGRRAPEWRSSVSLSLAAPLPLPSPCPPAPGQGPLSPAVQMGREESR